MAEPPLRILLVDDEAPARRRLRDLLDDCATALPLVVVGEAQQGREALDLLQSAPADLVLTDIHMPDMDGIELARHLLKLAHPPVVIFTTAFHEHAVQAFEVNAIDYLMKPVRVQRLLALLAEFPGLGLMAFRDRLDVLLLGRVAPGFGLVELDLLGIRGDGGGELGQVLLHALRLVEVPLVRRLGSREHRVVLEEEGVVLRVAAEEAHDGAHGREDRREDRYLLAQAALVRLVLHGMVVRAVDVYSVLRHSFPFPFY